MPLLIWKNLNPEIRDVGREAEVGEPGKTLDFQHDFALPSPPPGPATAAAAVISEGKQEEKVQINYILLHLRKKNPKNN